MFTILSLKLRRGLKEPIITAQTIKAGGLNSEEDWKSHESSNSNSFKSLKLRRGLKVFAILRRRLLIMIFLNSEEDWKSKYNKIKAVFLGCLNSEEDWKPSVNSIPILYKVNAIENVLFSFFQLMKPNY